MALITHVDKSSPFRKRILVGDDLIAVNGVAIRDFLDYMYQTALGVTDVTVRREGKIVHEILSEPADEPGLDFENYLMDQQRSCKNKCIFCFIDQLPEHMRETMYYKDDDFRLSLLYGNYVTLTNMTDEDLDRIVDMRVSPFNVSVHTTNPELRVKMMKNPAAAKVFDHMKRFRDAEINMRAQIVLCPDWNDGEELDRTLEDLKTLHPQLSSISVVPVGLTRHREGLEPLRCFTPEECGAVIDQVERFADRCQAQFGTRLVWCSDELYLKAGRPIPTFDSYEEFEQMENGVGMIASFEQELEDLLSFMDEPFCRPIRVSSVTGLITQDLMNRAVIRLQEKYTDLQCTVYGIRNDFFGHDVTVTGLVTGQDIIAQLQGKSLGDYLIVPDVMLRDNKFLDDVSVKDVEHALKVKIRVAEAGPEGFADALMRSARR
ncbi:MAG: DUF512 domain-containing protein [Clostridia bacterium]|nr:DUF512 domain-containing protein [Clostridia bacterium]